MHTFKRTQNCNHGCSVSGGEIGQRIALNLYMVQNIFQLHLKARKPIDLMIMSPHTHAHTQTDEHMHKAWKFNQMKARGNYALNTIN